MPPVSHCNSYSWTSMPILRHSNSNYWTSMASKWRRRQRPNNSGHLAKPWDNAPRNQISRSVHPSLRQPLASAKRMVLIEFAIRWIGIIEVRTDITLRNAWDPGNTRNEAFQGPGMLEILDLNYFLNGLWCWKCWITRLFENLLSWNHWLLKTFWRPLIAKMLDFKSFHSKRPCKIL